MLRLQNGASYPKWIQRTLAALQPHRTALLLMSGLAVQWFAVSCTVSRPLSNRISGLASQVEESTARLDQLVGVRGSAQRGQDLLSALEAQRDSLAAAEQSLADMRGLRMQVEQEVRLTAAASRNLTQLVQLQQRVQSAGAKAAELVVALEQVEAMNARLEALSAPTRECLAQADETKQALVQVNRLQALLAEQGDSLPAAQATLAAVLELQAALATAGPESQLARKHADSLVDIAHGLNSVASEDVAAASDHATDLLALHDMLADADSLHLTEAESNLQALLAAQSTLLHATPGIAAAADNLELLTEFQSELDRQLASLVALRRELLEISLLRDTVQRVAEAVAPLAEMSDLRRVDPDQVRAMAREILDRRTARAETAAAVTSDAAGGASLLESEPVERPVPQPQDAR